jgi:hypothetical protein
MLGLGHSPDCYRQMRVESSLVQNLIPSKHRTQPTPPSCFTNQLYTCCHNVHENTRVNAALHLQQCCDAVAQQTKPHSAFQQRGTRMPAIAVAYTLQPICTLQSILTSAERRCRCCLHTPTELHTPTVTRFCRAPAVAAVCTLQPTDFLMPIDTVVNSITRRRTITQKQFPLSTGPNIRPIFSYFDLKTFW